MEMVFMQVPVGQR